MTDPHHVRDLLFADLAVEAGVNPQDVADAIENARHGGRPVDEALEAVGALAQETRVGIGRTVERLVAQAGGSPEVALARRGGIDRSIHRSLRPETSTALLGEGAGARAPLRVVDHERYRDFTVVGRGGMGVVYLALDTELNRRVAFKMVRPDPRSPKESPAHSTPLEVTPPSLDVSDEEHRSFEELKIRFLQEAWVTGAMEHPGVVPVYELGRTTAGIPYYTMRYVTGERTLATAIKATDDLDGRLALLEPFLKVCDTVRYAHSRDVMHRDLKPENVALGEFGEAVVLDWGLSKMTGRPDVSGDVWRARLHEYREATDLRTVAGALGTPGYMAPEAALGRSDEVDHRSDIYSLGAILFEILTGRLPHRFKNFLEYAQRVMEDDAPVAHKEAEGVPRELSDICARALARDKADRYESVDEMASSVRRWQTEGRLNQQIEELVETARGELLAARESAGNIMLWHLDRAQTACTRVLHLKKNHADAVGLSAEIKQLRETGIKLRVSAGRRRLVAAAGFLILAAASIVALVVANRFAEQRREAQAEIAEERGRTAASKRAGQALRHDREAAVARTADVFASLSSTLLDDDQVAAARLAAARALDIAPTPNGWRALAAAYSRPTPALYTVLRDLLPGPVALGPRGRMLYVTAPGGVGAWDLDAGSLVKTLKTGPVRLMQLSQNGDYLAVCDEDGTFTVWMPLTGETAPTLPSDDATKTVLGVGPATSLAMSEDGRFLYTGHRGNLLQWDVETGDTTLLTATDGAVTAIYPTDKSLYYGTTSGSIARFRLENSAQDTFDTDGGSVLDVFLSREFDSIYGCTADHRLSAVERDPFHVLDVFRGPIAELAHARASRDTRLLYTVDRQGTVAAWNTTDKVQLWNNGMRGAVAGFSVSLDGSRIAVSRGTTVYVWALHEGSVAASDTETARVGGPDGKRVWIGHPDHSLELRDETGKALARWKAHDARITALALEGEQLISASLDGTIAVWPLSGGDAVASFAGPRAPTALSIGSDNSLCVGTFEGAVERWSLGRKRLIAPLVDSGQLPIVALRVDGPLLHSWDTAGVARTWDLRTREPATVAAGAPPPPAAWLQQSARLRLISVENAHGLRLNGVRVVPVAIDEYRPERPRLQPWSKD